MATSAFAGNPLLIDLLPLVDAGWLEQEPLLGAPIDDAQVRFEQVIAHKRRLLDAAFEGFSTHASVEEHQSFAAFCDAQAWWLEDFALFMVLSAVHDGGSWSSWAEPLRRRSAAALAEVRAEHPLELERVRFVQYLFFHQWQALRAYANSQAVSLVGDIPIFVAYDSADVWSNQEIFWLDEAGRPTVVAGVPPDYFSATGQLWGNPLYRWDVLAEQKYAWWIKRFRAMRQTVDEVRIDHFRGFAAYWEVEGDAETAIDGRWVKGPGRAMFDQVHAELGAFGIIAEDLGVITPDVDALRAGQGYPGMKVLQFGFGGNGANPHLPHNHTWDCVVYTGTHDNDTTVGWYLSAPAHVADHVRRYGAFDGNEIAWQLMAMAWGSCADLAIAPVQDVLGFGSDARMNTPGTSEGNWGWRLQPGQLGSAHATRLAALTDLYGRLATTEEEDADAEPTAAMAAS